MSEQTGSGLREQLEAALAEIETLKGAVQAGQGAQRELAFHRAGIDTTEGVGKLLAKTYDGDLDPEAISAYAKDYGIEPGATSTQAPAAKQDPTQSRMDALRQESSPQGTGKRLSFNEWSQLSKDDPPAAQAAHADGLVDFPSHMASALAAPNGAA